MRMLQTARQMRMSRIQEKVSENENCVCMRNNR